MCLAVPARILSITDSARCLALADSGGIEREIDLSCVAFESSPEALIGRWVLVHVGVALTLISDDEARASLEAWTAVDEAQTQ